jgi:hypothetical protein
MKESSYDILVFITVMSFVTALFKIYDPRFTYGGNNKYFRNRLLTPLFFVIPGILLAIVISNESRNN